MDENWKQEVDSDMKMCRDSRVRLEEHDKSQQKEIDENNRIIVGVNDYKTDDKLDIPILKMDEKGEERQINRLNKLKKDRNNQKVMRNLEELSKTAKSEKNMMPSILNCVHSYATLGEICQILRDIFGEYEEPNIY